MDMLDQALDSGEDKIDSGSENHIELGVDGAEGMANVNPGTLTIDENGQYRLTTDTGQVTYRVVQVSQDDGQPQVIANTLPSSQLMPHLNVVSPDGMDGLTDTKLGYLPTLPSGGGDATISQSLEATPTLGTVNGSGSGQFYVMMSPQDVLQAAGQRVIAPRSSMMGGRADQPRTTRDDRRRQSHNEVERRRRDKINNWIVQLSKLIPNCDADISKSGQIQSKGGILSKACDHINALRQANAAMADTLKEAERFSVDNELLTRNVAELTQENTLLHNLLQQHGIVPPDDLHAH